MLISASCFWYDAIIAFIFNHGPMTPTLADVHMLTRLKITREMSPFDLLSKGSQKLGKILGYSGWKDYISTFIGTGPIVDDKEHVAFLNMWLERFIFCGSSYGPTQNHKFLAEQLAAKKEIPLGKYLLGSAYHLMHQVAAQILKNQSIQYISGPWWFIQLRLNLYTSETWVSLLLTFLKVKKR